MGGGRGGEEEGKGSRGLGRGRLVLMCVMWPVCGIMSGWGGRGGGGREGGQIIGAPLVCSDSLLVVPEGRQG